MRPEARLIVALSLAVISLGREARAQVASLGDSAWFEMNSKLTVPVVFTISGGISLGSYQSGVNWALVRFVRHVYDDPAYREAERMPRLKFTTMAGASAGNINALLSAVAWCTDSGHESPEESIFWKTWVTVGWPQLFPPRERRNDWGGIFDRHYYAVGPFRSILDAMKRKSLDCDMPLGMTMTRVEPTTTSITENIGASTQRYAALLNVKGDSLGRGVAFVQPEARLFLARSLGAVASLGAHSGEILDSSQVLNTLMASSAFPVAFAKVDLTYIPGEKVAQAEACFARARNGPRCGSWITTAFIDGGVFDNNPLALAFGLYRERVRGTVDSSARARILYINPDALRDSLRAARAEHITWDHPEPTGIAAFTKVLKGAVPSARQYELQWLARSLSESRRDSSEIPYIATTDRGYPIVAEHLYAFAGFLGRPFREYDFYAGTYDGLHYVAQHMLCAQKRRVARGDTASNGVACTHAELQLLIADSATFAFTPTVRAILLDFFEAEYSRPPSRAEESKRPTVAEQERYDVNHQLVVANSFEFREHLGCSSGDLVDRTLCSDGFGGLVRRFSTPRVRDILREWSQRPECSDAIPGHPNCLADEFVVDLVDGGPRAFASKRINDIFEQIYEDPQQPSGTKKMVGAIELLFRAVDDAHQPTVVLNPSTIPPYADKRWRAVPYRVNGVWARGAVAGVEATYVLSAALPGRILRKVRVTAPFGISRISTADTPDAGVHNAIHAGAGVSYHVGNPLAHDIQIDAQIAEHTGPQPFAWQDRLTYHIVWNALGGKLSVGTGRLSKSLRRPGKSGTMFTLGAGDLGGIVYWAARLMK